MADLAKAYVQIIPSAQGIEGQLENLMGGEAEAAGTKAGGLFAGKFGTALKIGGLAAATGLFAVGKEALSAYADLEQLTGGVEKIFDSANIEQIFQDANSAYKDLNMSANDYLAAINQTGAAFAQTMGDQKGYDTARTGMTAIADYASGTGRNLDELNQKYALITRSTSSYQSIADQFSGILPATSADFLEQAQAAGFLSESYTKLTEVPVAEYQEAVTNMLEKGVAAMGLAGNTAKESMTTVSGSLAMTKTAWENLVAGLANPNADLGKLTSNLIESAGALADNIVPVIGQALKGIGEAAPQLVESLVSGLTENLPAIVEGGVQLLAGLVTGLIQAMPQLISYAPQIISTLLNGILGGLDQILGAGEQLLEAACNGIGNAIGSIFAKGAEMAQNAWNGITSWFGQIFQAGAEIVTQAGNGIAGAASSLYSKGTELVQKVKDGFMAMVRGAVSWGSDLVKNIASGIMSAISWVSNAASSIANAISRPLKHSVPTEGPLADDDKWGGHLVQNLIGGMQREEGNLRRQAEGVAGIVRDSMRFDTSFRLQAQPVPVAAFAGGGGYGSGDVVAELQATRRALMNMGFYADGERIGDMVDRGLGRRRNSKERRTV